MNVILMLILIIILSLGGYFIWTENKIVENQVKYTSPVIPKIEAIVISKKSIEFTLVKNKNDEYTFSGVFSKENTPKVLVKYLDMKKLKHDIYIKSELKYDENVVFLAKKLFKQLIDNYIEGSIVYKKDKLLISGSVKSEEDKEVIDDILAYYSSVNSFNNTKIDSSPIKNSDINSETVEIISNLVKAVDNGEKTISEYVKPKVIIKEKVVVKYKKPKVIIKEKVVVKYKKPKVITKEKIVVKYKKPKVITKEKIVVKYVPVPVVNNKNDIYSKMTKDEYLKKLNSKHPDKSIMSLPAVDVVDMDIEDKIKKGLVKPLRTTKPLVKKGTIYLPSKEKKIDENIPWAELHDMDAKLNGIVYDDVVASPAPD